MMEREFVARKTKEYRIKKYLESKLSNVGLSQIRLKKIPLGEKIIITTSRPSLIVGSKGSNIKDLTRYLKKEFKLENPQVEINEIKQIYLDANVVAENIASSLERFGSARFKGVGHKTIENVMRAGALGVEIIISGKIPGARAKSWRFYQGYLKKCGDISLTGVRRSKKVAALKSGIIGIKVSIMPPNIKLPDQIKILDEPVEVVEEIKEEKKKPTKKKATKKKTVKKESKKKKVETKTVKETPKQEVKKKDNKEEKKTEDEKIETKKEEVKAEEKKATKITEEEKVEVKQTSEEISKNQKVEENK